MIGCGNMGGALLQQWCTLPDFRITVVTPGSKTLPAGVSHFNSPQALESQQFDGIVVAVKPQMIREVVPTFRANLGENGCVISIAAGFSAASFEQLLGDVPIVRIMPNLPSRIGRGVSGVYATDRCQSQHRGMADSLANAAGYVVAVDSEDELDRVTAVAGSGPGYAFEIARCWTQAAEELGFSADVARGLALNTLAGTLEMALNSSEELDDLRNSVTSKNGTTAAGLSMLRDADVLTDLFRATFNAAYDRARELR